MAEKKRGRPPKKEAEKVETEVASEPEIQGVGGNNNLIPLNRRAKEEQMVIQSAGGKASVKARRMKKELRDFTKDFLMQEASSVLKQNMKTLGVEDDDMSNLAAMIVRLFTKATNQGDLNAARTLIEWAGMAPLQQIKENAAIAQLSQAMEMGGGIEESEDDTDVVFYIPNNNRAVVKEDYVTVE